MGLSVTSSTEIPATVYERAKKHIRSNDADADSVMLYLETAIDDCENYTGRALWNKTYKWTFDDFGSVTELKLPRCPVVSVSSIKYYDEDGLYTTFNLNNCNVAVNDDMAGVIKLKDSADWPEIESDNTEAVEVEFIAGYGTGMGSIPGTILGGIILYASHMFDCRDASAAEDLEPIRHKFFNRYRARWYA